jgi:hypothetical protein
MRTYDGHCDGHGEAGVAFVLILNGFCTDFFF